MVLVNSQTYQTIKENKYFIHNSYSFSEKDEAGKEKLKIGKDLVSIVIAEENLKYLDIDGLHSKSDWFLFGGSICSMSGRSEYPFSIMIKAVHYKKPDKSGIYSVLDVTRSFGYGNRIGTPIDKKFERYLTNYSKKRTPNAQQVAV